MNPPAPPAGRIVFVMYNTKHVRQFESMVRLLADRGHRVGLAFQRREAEAAIDREALELARSLAAQCPGVELLDAAERRDRWTALAAALRSGVDYLRYLQPPFERTPRLRARHEWLAPRTVVALARWPGVRTARGLRLLGRLLRRLDRALPDSQEVTEFVRAHRPDLLLVTPLVREPTQVDYVRSARRLGVRSGLPVASWDNLTNKGVVRALPDRVYVWNEVQLREAVELHGVPAVRVTVTGAHTFDPWFDRAPSRSREELCAVLGLDPGHPILLYLCSSAFLARAERPFVERWVDALRACPDPRLREAGVLVRPHPDNGRQWAESRLSERGGVAVWPPTGASTTTPAAKADFFDSMHHARAVVGLNTSAMIESAIVGRPVLSLLLPEYEPSQEGTLHFRYLMSEQGGPLTSGRGYEEHFAQLAAALEREPGAAVDAVRGFLESFVRPLGLERAATPILVEAIEAQLGEPAPAPVSRTAGDTVLAGLMPPLALAARWSDPVVERLRPARRSLRRGRRRVLRQGRRARRSLRKRVRRSRGRLPGLGRS